MNSSYYSRDELLAFGFKSIGKNVFISKKASIYSANEISLGSFVRIDDFCILSGKITIGSFVHISAYVAIYGKGEVEIGDFCGISPKSIIFSASDDFSGEFMISPMVPSFLCNLHTEKVVLKNYSQLGASTIVMPGVTLEEGATTGAFTFVNKNLPPWSINIGVPSRYLKRRDRNAKKLSQMILHI